MKELNNRRMTTVKETEFSILDLKISPFKDEARPAFFLDLNLNQIIDRICREWGEDVREFYYYLPADGACEDYRREVFEDIKQNGVYEILCNFAREMSARQEASDKKEDVRMELQKALWHVREAGHYCEAFMRLSYALEKIPLKSRGMIALKNYLQQYLAGEGFKRMREKAAGLLEQASGFRLVMTYENDRIIVSKGEVYGAYDKFLEGCFPGQKKKIVPPFGVSKDLSELEQEIIKIHQKHNPAFFREVGDFCRQYREYADDALLRFGREIRYYLSFYCFEQKMREEGFAFVRPSVIDFQPEWPGCGKPVGGAASGPSGSEAMSERSGSGAASELPENEALPERSGSGAASELPGSESAPEQPAGGFVQEQASEMVHGREMSARGLYDLALACAGHGEVVSNDMAYGAHEKFFVLTGPNQGGKTTFARSLGQLVYFTKMGLDVPAQWADVYRFGDIMTHFSVEESVETGRGKLKEELMRLAPMMEPLTGLPFVVINELFTTAANYDALIMGKRVLEHFLSLGCHGIYVTHLKELSQAHPQIVSLRAMLDGNGIPNFKIARGAASDEASAMNQVNKYKLTYEQLKERLS